MIRPPKSCASRAPFGALLGALAALAGIGAAAPARADGVENAAICGAASVATSAVASAASNGRALLIGIDNYEDPQIPDLSGARNDVCLFRDLLVSRYGFRDDDITILVDAAATREGILSAMDARLAAYAAPGTRLVLHYSGHGARVPDADGDESAGDGFDETLVPYDGDADGGRHILDDELWGRLNALAATGARVTVVFDSCHSGGALRTSGQVRRLDRGFAAVPAGPAQDDAGFLDEPAAANADIAFLAAARADQPAQEYEFKGRTHGAFTYALADVLRDAPPGITYAQAVGRAAAVLQAEGVATQKPQFNGRRAADAVFATPGVAPETLGVRVARLDARADGRFYVLTAGVIHDATVGSRYAAYRDADALANGLDAAPTPDAVLEIVEVDAMRSRAHLIGGDPPAAGWRAVEVDHVYPFGGPRLAVDAAMSSGDRDRVAAAAAAADVEIVSGARAPYRAARDRSSWVLLSRAGETLYEANTPDALMTGVTAWTRWTSVALLRNDEPGSPVFDATAVLGDARPAPSARGEPAIEAYRDEPFWLVARNQSRKALHFAVVDLADDGAITPLYPLTTDDSRAVAPGQAFMLPLSASMRAAHGEETAIVKVFASPEPIDLGALSQDQLRAIAPDDPLGRLLWDAVGAQRATLAPSAWSARDVMVVARAP